MRWILIASLTLCGVAPATRTVAAQTPTGGRWIGGFRIGGEATFFRARFAADSAGTKGTIDIPAEWVMDAPLAEVAWVPPRVRFALPVDSNPAEFDGSVVGAGPTIVGRVRRSAAEGTFALIRMGRLDPTVFRRFTGAYRVGGDRLILIDQVENALRYLETESGRVGTLVPTSETTFLAGPSYLVPYPTQFQLSFTTSGGGAASELLWTQTGFSGHLATRIPLPEEEVSFTSGDVTLSGTLVRPQGPGPHGAVIFVHTYDGQPRSRFYGLGYLYAERGIAVLAFDKRGVGASTGDWRRASLDDLAGDAVAGLRYLQQRQDIDPKRVGFWGFGQGAWVAPLAAARAGDAAFVVMVGGGGMVPAQQRALETEFALRSGAFTDQQVDDAMRLRERKMEYLRTGWGWLEYRAAMEQWRGEPWFNYPGTDVAGPITGDHPTWNLMRLTYFKDPAPVLERLTSPVLAVFGEMEAPDAVKAGVRNIEAALKKGGLKDRTVRVLRQANQSLLEAETGTPREYARLKRFVPGFLDLVVDWVAKRAAPES